MTRQFGRFPTHVQGPIQIVTESQQKPKRAKRFGKGRQTESTPEAIAHLNERMELRIYRKKPYYPDLPCRHCNDHKINRPRGLCWSCYYKPGVKELYPSTSKYAKRGVPNFNRAAMPAAWPTKAEPGTPEKVAVMELRASLGQELFHPQDAMYVPKDDVTTEPDLHPADPLEYEEAA